MNVAPTSAPRCRGWLMVFLTVSVGLRFWLVGHGGQGYWPDEARYQSSEYAATALEHGQWRAAAAQLLGRADHPLFTWIGLPPALVERWYGARPGPTACYFSLFSVLVIGLVWRVARRAGAGEPEALAAAGLAACANSLFYYARHFFPYDPALALMLLALDAALGPPSAGRSLRAGGLAALGFLTYEGYWLLGGVVLILHAGLGAGGWRRMAGRAILAGLGLAAVLAAYLGAARLAGYNLVAALRDNAATITQGDFGRGYRIIAAYLWRTEGLLAVGWLAGAAVALILWVRRRGPARAAWWLAGLVLVTAGLVLLSDAVPVFVVYGRLVRQLVPFFCLATAFALNQCAALAARPRRVWLAAAAVAGLLAAGNLAGPLRQMFPDEFRRLATAEVFQRQQRDGYGVYRIVNDEHLWGRPVGAALPPNGIILRRAHPLQFRPYQYEGFTAAQRGWLNGSDISMRLIRLTGGGEAGASLDLPPDPAAWDGYPGPVHLRVVFVPGAPDCGQPLVTAGTARRADFLYVRAVGTDQIRFGYDHWEGGTVLSEPIAVDFSRPHDVVVSLGAMLPPMEELLRQHPQQAYLRSLLLVAMDGRIVWSQWSAAHTVPRETITFGANFVGGSTTVREFAGRILRLERAPLESILPHVGLLAGRTIGSRRPPDWGGAPGPLVLRCTLPDLAPGMAEPLLAAGVPGEGDLLFWLRERDGRVRFGFDRHGEGAVFSEPEAAPPGRVHELVVSLGSLMPPAASVLYESNPDLQRLRDLLLVSLDGRVVFQLKRPFVEPAGGMVVGANSVGSSVAGAFFTGNLLSLDPAEPAAVLAASIELASRIESRSAAWQGYPGPVRLTLKLPPDVPRLPEPLIVTGRTGRGDFIYVRYETDHRIRFGFDHWGVSGGESEPVAIDPATVHRVEISFGGLMPPADSPLYRQEPDWLRLRRWLFIALDGRPVFRVPLAAHPTQPGQITLATNFIGGSTTEANFTGQIISAEALTPAQVLAQLDAAGVTGTAP
ncbi:MAG TPA: hypothetical protein VMD31_09250 [Opitutaceae bacterium]|nr:hypothetical protein [Opitutaceae bacterium]